MAVLFESDFETPGKTFADNWTTYAGAAADTTPYLSSVKSGAGMGGVFRDSHPARDNVELLCKFRRDTSAASRGTVGFGLSNTGSYGTHPPNGAGIYVYWYSSNAYALRVNGATVSFTGTVPTPANASVWYWIRLRWVNKILSIKIWTDGTPEPADFQGRVNLSTTNVTAGNVTLYHGGSVSGPTYTSLFDDIVVTDGVAVSDEEYSEQVVAVTEDIRSDAQYRDANYGQVNPITFGTGAAAYIAFFNMPQPTLGAGDTIVSARLKLVASASATTTAMSVYTPNGPWSENTLTYNNMPTLTKLYDIAVPALAVDATLNIELPPPYRFENGIALTRPSSTTSAYSSEAASNGPEIIYGIQSASGAVTYFRGWGIPAK